MTSIYREMICQFIIENWPTWEQKVQNNHNNTMTFTKYIQSMLYGKEWATSAEIEAAPHVFNIKINVWLQQVFPNEPTKNGYSKFTFSSDSANTEVNVLLSGAHFQPIKKVLNSSSNSLHFSVKKHK